MDFSDSFDEYAPYEQIAATLTGPAGSAPMRASSDEEPWLANIGATGAGATADRGLIAGAVAGFLGAAVALGVANLAAAFVRPQASPLVAAGTVFIDRTPPALKKFAVREFGESDQKVLLLGLYVAIAVIATVIGMTARRRVWTEVAGIGLFVLSGALVVLTRPASHVTDVIPSIVGGVAAAAAVAWLIRAGTGQADYGPLAYQAADDEPRDYEAPGYEADESSGYEPSGYERPGYEFPGGEPYEWPGYEPPGQERLSYGSPSYRTGSAG